jgi:hypothetical protein
MRGVLEDCFQITGRSSTVVAVLVEDDELVRIGNWMVVEELKWRIVGLEFIKRARPPTEEDLRRIAFLIDAPKEELVPLIGRRFETVSASA